MDRKGISNLELLTSSAIIISVALTLYSRVNEKKERIIDFYTNYAQKTINLIEQIDQQPEEFNSTIDFQPTPEQQEKLAESIKELETVQKISFKQILESLQELDPEELGHLKEEIIKRTSTNESDF